MKAKLKRALALLVINALLISMLPMGGPLRVKAATRAGHGLNNPRTNSNGGTTWDCVYFGNYWQEDTNGDGKADKNDTKQPIKWRVLSVDGNDAFLLADKNLDVVQYSYQYASVTWETSTMRSWLNGYGEDQNVLGRNYSIPGSNFLSTAFTEQERQAVKTTNVANNNNPEYNTEGGNDTLDKVYLLSIDEVTDLSYGFIASTSENAESRRALNTDFVKDEGECANVFIEQAVNGNWWLRSPGNDNFSASIVYPNGSVKQDGCGVFFVNIAVRPALHLDLSATSNWSYAGTVTSEGEGTGAATPTPGKTGTEEEKKIANILPDMGNLGSAELKGPELSIGNNTFNLFKTNVNLSLPITETEGVKISIDQTEHTAEILLGVEGQIESDPDDPYWKETYQQVKSLVKACGGKVNTNKLWNQFSKVRGKLKKIEGDAVFKVSGNAAGYIKLQLDENNNPVNLIEGGVAAGLEAGVKVKTPLWWIIYSEFGVAGSVDGKMYLTMTETKTVQAEGELGLAVKPSVAIGADAVVVDVKGGLEGTIGGKISFPVKSFRESVNAYLTGKAFIQVDTVVPGLSGGYDFNFPVLELYPELGKVEKQAVDLQYERSRQPAQNIIRSMKRYATDAVDTVKQSVIYENAKPEMAVLPDGRLLMTYLDDTVEKAEGQAKLMYRVYADGEWGEANSLNDTSNLDTAGKLYVYNNTVYVIYESSSQSVTESMTEKEILDGMELYVAAFDAQTGMFAAPVQMGAEEGAVPTWKYGYSLISYGSGLYAVWAENSVGDVLLQSGDTDICCSELTADGWSEKKKLVSVDGAVQEFCIWDQSPSAQQESSHVVEPGNPAGVVYIKDGVLYVDGGKQELPGNRTDSARVFGGTLYFRLDGRLYSSKGGAMAPSDVMCTTSYRVLGDTVYWTEQDNFKSEVYKKELTGQGSPVAVTDEGGYIGNFCLVSRPTGDMPNGSAEDEEVCLAYTFQHVDETAKEGSPYGLTLLKFTGDVKRNQAEVSDLAYDILSFEPGAENDIVVTVANTGTTELNHLVAVISDQEGNVLHEEEVSVLLKPGEFVEKTLSVSISEGMAGADLIAAVRADEAFEQEEKAEKVMQMQTSTANLQLASSDQDTLLISNKASETADQVTVCVRDGGEGGELLMEKNIGLLDAGESMEVSIVDLWSEAAVNTDTGKRYLYCEVSQDAVEYELWDNSLSLQKESGEIPPVETGIPEPSASTTPTEMPDVSPTDMPGQTTKPGEGPTLPPVPPASVTPTKMPDVSSTAAPGAAVPLPSISLPQLIAPVSQTPVPPASAGVGKISSVKLKQKKQAVTVSWKKVSGAAGYQICYSTSKKWKNKKLKLTRNNKFAAKNLKKKKTYYFRVRAYRMNGAKKVYGAWSKTKKIKMKK